MVATHVSSLCYLFAFGVPDSMAFAAGGVSSFPVFLEKFFPEVLGGKGSNAYCTYNSQKLQMFTSCYFLAGKFCLSCLELLQRTESC